MEARWKWRWRPWSVSTRPRPPCRVSVRGCGTRGWRGMDGQRADEPRQPMAHQAPLVWRMPEGLAAVPVGGGLAGQRANAPSHTSTHQVPLVWRAPEGPEGTGGLRGAAPNAVRTPSLAGGRAIRRPEHPWDHKHRRNTSGARSAAAPRTPRVCQLLTG